MRALTTCRRSSCVSTDRVARIHTGWGQQPTDPRPTRGSSATRSMTSSRTTEGKPSKTGVMASARSSVMQPPMAARAANVRTTSAGSSASTSPRK